MNDGYWSIENRVDPDSLNLATLLSPSNDEWTFGSPSPVNARKGSRRATRERKSAVFKRADKELGNSGRGDTQAVARNTTGAL